MSSASRYGRWASKTRSLWNAAIAPIVPEPPLRLPLGSDAYMQARAADEAKIASDERWKDLILSTDAMLTAT